jgi:FkbM family methyltransferase
VNPPAVTPSLVPVAHPWPLRVVRSLQFAWARLRSHGGYVNARAAPFDLTFTGPGADCITRHIYRLGAHEPEMSRHLIDHVRLGPDDVAFDVGANLGWYSVLLDRLSAPGARIFAFEPDPESYRLLLGNLAANGTTRVTALNLALGARPGFADLYRYRKSNNGRHSLLHRNPAGLVRVPVTTLGEFWQREQLGQKSIRFMKLDVEGYEYFVLQGAGDLLRRCACLQLEYSSDSFQTAGLDAGAMIRLLAGAGLSARVFAQGELRPISYPELARLHSQRDLILTPARAPAGAGDHA